MGLDVVAIQEIAAMLGVSKQRVSRIIQTHPEFPEPDGDLSIGRVWLRSTIEEWIETYDRRPGRSPGPPTTMPEATALPPVRTEAAARLASRDRPKRRGAPAGAVLKRVQAIDHRHPRDSPLGPPS